MPTTRILRLRADAKHLRRAFERGEADARTRVAAVLGQTDSLKHADALHVIAREQGAESWPRLKFSLEAAGMDRAARAQRLRVALYHGQHWVVRHLLAQDPDLPDDAFDLQIATYDLPAVQAALTDPEAAKRPLGRRTPILHLAFSQYIDMAPEKRTDMLAIARLLLANGADPNDGFPWQPGEEHQLSALYGALGHANNLPLAELLLDSGATPNDNESLYHATELPTRDGLRLLLKHGADPTGTNALPRALDFGDLETITLLLEHGADPNEGIADHPSGEAPIALPALHQAARRWCSGRIVQALLDHGADPAARWQGLTPYATARVYGNAEAAQVLARAGHAPTLTDAEETLAACAEGRTPSRRLDPAGLPLELARLATRIAARPERLDHLRCLLLAGLDPEQGDEMDLTPLHIAGWEGLPEQVAYLLTLSPDLARRNAYGGDALGTVIHGAEFCPARATRDHVACAKLLLEAGATLDPDQARTTGSEDMAAFLESRLP